MSYKTYINGVQFFGNNECYSEWIDFIRSQGIQVSSEDCYEGKITDFMGALVVIEKITLRLAEEKKIRNANLREREIQGPADEMRELFDFTNIPEDIKNQKRDDISYSLFDSLSDVIRKSYAFMPYRFYLICKNKLQKDNVYAIEGHFDCYKIKTDATITVRAVSV